MDNRRALTAILFLVLAVLRPAAWTETLPDGPAKPVVERMCTACHELTIGTAQRQSREKWAALVEEMIGRGATGSAEEIAAVVDYLAANFGPSPTSPAAGAKINVNRASSEELARAVPLSTSEADAIVKYRQRNPAFKEWREVAAVPGVDAKKIESAKDRIVF